MGGGCSDSEYWDELVRKCMSCERTCEAEHRHDRCVEFCASLHCRADPGHFYDPLLKQCMRCAELCGSHPVECARACKAQPTARSLTQLPEDRAALPLSPTRGSSLPGGEHHTVIIYSLLGLCLAALFCTLSVALLVLLCRSRGRWTRGGHKAGPQEQEISDGTRHPSSEDRLMDAVVGGQGRGPAEEKKAWPTETCVHCFPELCAQQQVEDKLPPPSLYQQATGMAPPTGAPTPLHRDAIAVATNRQASLHGPGGKDGALRIICSPTQSG